MSIRDSEAIEAVDDAFSQERVRGAQQVLKVRMWAVSAWFVAYIGYTLFMSPEIAQVLLFIGVYSAVSIFLYLLARQYQVILKYSWYALALVDIPAIFSIQYVTMGKVPWSSDVTAGFGMVLGLVIVIFAQLSFKRKTIILCTISGIVTSTILFSRIGEARAVVSIVLVFVSVAWLSIYMSQRVSKLLEQIIARIEESKRIQRELELAREIQQNLLPEKPSPNYPVQGLSIPFYEMSGDFYDHFPLDDGRIYFNLADVSGKGLNAALLMAKTSSLFHCLGKTIHSPGKLLALINNELVESSKHGMFVTMVGGIYDPVAGTVTLANAGHHSPVLICSSGEIKQLAGESPPLGIVANTHIPDTEVKLSHGSLYLYTDGVTEVRKPDGNELEVNGLIDLIKGRSAVPRSNRLYKIVDDMLAMNAELRDDITLLVVEELIEPGACA